MEGMGDMAGSNGATMKPHHDGVDLMSLAPTGQDDLMSGKAPVTAVRTIQQLSTGA
jgi:hypothetical protein